MDLGTADETGAAQAQDALPGPRSEASAGKGAQRPRYGDVL